MFWPMVIGNDTAVKIKALTLEGNGVRDGRQGRNGERPAVINRDG